MKKRKAAKKAKKPVASVTGALSAQQERFCEEYLIDYNGQKAATRAGYSEKTAASQAWRLLKNAKVLTRVRDLQHEQAERLAISSDWVMLQLRDCYQRCMSKEPVMAFNPVTHAMEDTGEWQFDSRGANRALELIGRQVGMFESKVNLKGDMDYKISVNYGTGAPLADMGTDETEPDEV